MKVFQLLVFLLFSATAHCNPYVPVSFFAKVNGTLKPLFPIPHRSSDGVIQVMSYGTSQNVLPPTQFIVQWKSAYTEETNSPGYLGFYSGYFAFTSFMQEADFDLDRDRKVRQTFYSCEMFHPKFPSILNEKSGHNCFQVDLYLLAYDPVSKSAIKAVSEETTMGFFAKVNQTLEPLAAIGLGPEFEYLNIFVHRYPTAKPVEIIFSDNFGIIKRAPTRSPEYVVLFDGQLLFGSSVLPTTIRLNSEWMLLNGPFFSCALSKVLANSVRVISRTVPKEYSSHCFEVQLYLRPYDTIANSTWNGTAVS